MIFSRKLFIMILLLLPNMLWGQTDSLRFSVRGVVRDSSSGRILPEVGVYVPGTSYATVTNADGTFIIKSHSPIGSLSFSLIGYENLTQQAPEGGEEVMRVRLKPRDFTLDPSLVVSGDPAEIMRLAIVKIPDNYPAESELFDCFYRETVRKRQRFIYVSEAVTKIYKASFRDYFTPDRAALVKSRLLTSPRVSDTLGVKVIGGPSMAVNLDLVKTRGIIIDESQLQYYKLKLLPPAAIDGRMQFVISLTPAVEYDYALHNGVVYIDRETMAFTRIELSLDVTDQIKATKAMLVRSPAGLRFRPKEMSLQLNYKTEGGKSRLSYLKTVFRFGCDWRKRLFATDYTVVAETVMTKRYTGEQALKIPRKEALNDRTSLADVSAEYNDPDFWKDYNIIEPTVGLEHAVGRLKANN